MSGSFRYGVPAFDRPHRMIAGLCAAGAAMAGVPVWIVRTVAVIALILHFALAMIIYFAAAYIFRHAIRAALATPRYDNYTPGRPGAWSPGTWNSAFNDRAYDMRDRRTL